MNEFYKNLLTSAFVLIIGFILSIVVSKTSEELLRKIVKRTRTDSDDYIVNELVKIIKPIGWALTSIISWKILPISREADPIIIGTAELFCIVLLIRFCNKVVIRTLRSWSDRIEDQAVRTMLRSLGPMVRSLIWGIGIIFFLQNIGVQMAAIWALLSAGGIGAGLALKEPVQEFFEYITILLDKPFQNGQFIHIDNVWATVERVGVRSTRLRSLSGEIIVMSNSSLTNGVISNYAEMENRRISHRIGIIYDTNIIKVKKIPSLIKSIIDSTNDAIFDRCHFVEFGPSSLDFEFVYFIPTNNYLRAMTAQQEINIAIMECFKRENIEFAFPTQTIHLANSN